MNSMNSMKMSVQEIGKAISIEGKTGKTIIHCRGDPIEEAKLAESLMEMFSVQITVPKRRKEEVTEKLRHDGAVVEEEESRVHGVLPKEEWTKKEIREHFPNRKVTVEEMTQKKVAEILGYKNQSTVSRRLNLRNLTDQLRRRAKKENWRTKAYQMSLLPKQIQKEFHGKESITLKDIKQRKKQWKIEESDVYNVLETMEDLGTGRRRGAKTKEEKEAIIKTISGPSGKEKAGGGKTGKTGKTAETRKISTPREGDKLETPKTSRETITTAGSKARVEETRGQRSFLMEGVKEEELATLRHKVSVARSVFDRISKDSLSPRGKRNLERMKSWLGKFEEEIQEKIGGGEENE